MFITAGAAPVPAPGRMPCTGPTGWDPASRMGSWVQNGIMPHSWAAQTGMGQGSNGNILPREMLDFNSLLCGGRCPAVKPFPM